MPVAFVSCAREDVGFVKTLIEALSDAGWDTTWDQDVVIPLGALFRSECEAAIRRSGKFIFIISPGSVGSEICRGELDFARSLNKQVIPLVRRDVPEPSIPEGLVSANWIHFEDDAAFSTGLAELVNAIDSDLDIAAEHARLLDREADWRSSGHSRSLLLRGRDLKAVKGFLVNASVQEGAPSLTTGQREYVAASRRWQRVRQGMRVAVLAVAVGFGTFWVVQLNTAGQAHGQQAKHQGDATAAVASALGAAAGGLSALLFVWRRQDRKEEARHRIKAAGATASPRYQPAGGAGSQGPSDRYQQAGHVRDRGDGGSSPPEEPRSRPRYLRGQCPEAVPVGKPFTLLASVVLAPGPVSAKMKPFRVPPGGQDVLLSARAPGLRILSEQRQIVHVPAYADSEPVVFELRADSPGAQTVSLEAWLGGTYLGQLVVEITAERGAAPRPHREFRAEMTTEATEGAVSLVVRYDKTQNAYRFEFRDEDYPAEVTSTLAYDPGPLVEQLIAGLDGLAKGRSGYSPEQARKYLKEQGANLWRELVPEPLRAQFWDRQHRIRQLTILADKDAVPWELLYPRDPGHDAGFLIDQFPVTRAVFGRRLPRELTLHPARFVLPGSLPEGQREIDAMRQLLDPDQPPGMVVSALTPLQDLIDSGDFGLLHFACHNRFDPADGSSITLGDAMFSPELLTTAAIDRVLAPAAPTVFINACRSAGFSATYNRLDGWASKFLEAGAASFIGSLWAVSDGAAREFAQELYGQLQAGTPLGEAVMRARQVAANQLDDPTWLAYTVYGDPRATVIQQP
jgi:hypothetical protein